VVIGAKVADLPPGAAGGLLAGSQTMSAAIGSAEQAVTQGAVKLAAGTTPEAVSAMIALSYGISYIWGTVGIILICKYLPKWWGVDAKQAAIAYEKEHGVRNVDDVGPHGYRPFAGRAYVLENRGLERQEHRRLPPAESRVPRAERAPGRRAAGRRPRCSCRRAT
jgi:putative transport protein